MVRDFRAARETRPRAPGLARGAEVRLLRYWTEMLAAPPSTRFQSDPPQ